VQDFRHGVRIFANSSTALTCNEIWEIPKFTKTDKIDFSKALPTVFYGVAKIGTPWRKSFRKVVRY